MCNPEPTTLAEYCQESVAASVMANAVSLPGMTDVEAAHSTPNSKEMLNSSLLQEIADAPAQSTTPQNDWTTTAIPDCSLCGKPSLGTICGFGENYHYCDKHYREVQRMFESSLPGHVAKPVSKSQTVGTSEQVPTKSNNPKDVASVSKCPVHLVPPVLIRSTAVALKNGAEKYGEFNWRSEPVQYMNYLAAILRHTLEILDGEDVDEQSGLEHVAHIAATCGIILDAADHHTLIDDRPGK